MKKLNSPSAGAIAIILTLFIGAALKYFSLPAYVIILGFRFHLGFTLPFLIYASFSKEVYIKKYLTAPALRKILGIVLICLIPAIVEGLLLALSFADLADPEYFYEFGLTSFVDFPIYFIWNLPQLLLFVLFVMNIIEKKKRTWGIPVASFFLFAYEAITVEKILSINYYALVFMFVAAVLIWSVFFHYKNIFEISFAIFFIIWGAVLINGSDSETLINLFFARNYEAWEGFIEWNKSIPKEIFLSAYMLICSIILFLLWKEKVSLQAIENIAGNEYNTIQ